MKRGMMVIPLVILWPLCCCWYERLARNAQGTIPRQRRSTLIGQPVPLFALSVGG